MQYVPQTDITADLTGPTSTTSYCPYKGDASYYSVAEVSDAAWSYAEPYPAVAEIAGHLAFYPNKAEVSVG